MNDVSQILSRIESGDPSAAEQLLPLVYEELRRLAAAKLSQEKPGHTLQATALVHEAYLRLAGADGAQQSWNTRGHFFAAAAEAMRRILVDNARRKRSPKHGGGRQRVDLDAAAYFVEDRYDEVLDVDVALAKLSAESPEKAELGCVDIHLAGFG